jgi:branched-chain amino acid transport system permease protein
VRSFARAKGQQALPDWGGFAALALAFVAAPFVLQSDYLHGILVVFAIYLLLLTGLNIIVGYAGQVSLAHAGLYGLGAYTAGILAAKLGWPAWLTFLAAPLAAALGAALVGAPSLRLRGFYFAMATLGAGTVLYLTFNRAVALTGGPNGLLGIPTLAVFGLRFNTPFAIYWLAAPLAFLGFVAAANLVRSRTGRALQALAIAEPGAEVVGVDTFRLKLAAFVLSSVYAGVAGALQTYQARFISPETFGFFTTVILLVILTLAGAGTVWGPVVGALLLTVLDEALAHYPDAKPLILGLVFLVVAQAFPHGLVGAVRRWRAATVPAAPVEMPGRPMAVQGEAAAPAPAGQRLEIQQVSKAFGGVRVLNAVSFVVAPGRITALIGPNGAGKSTLANIISGLEPPSTGRVLLGDIDLTHEPAHRRAAMGVGRTFQSLQLFTNLTVLENVLMGAYGMGRSGVLAALAHTPRTRAEEGAMLEHSLAILAELNLTHLAHRRVDALGFGQAKLVELARVLAMRPRVLVMDEPAAGLTPADVRAMTRRIADLAASGLTILLIEHNMRMVMDCAETIVVLDHGDLIASGSPAEIQTNERVIDAYLGRSPTGPREMP